MCVRMCLDLGITDWTFYKWDPGKTKALGQAMVISVKTKLDLILDYEERGSMCCMITLIVNVQVTVDEVILYTLTSPCYCVMNP
jgi:hypothetical protein